jgi:enoyl-CoA hydratase/carnithine racemase
MSDPLLVEAHDGVVRLTLNRPEKRNALSSALLTELEYALGAIGRDQRARVVVLAANGPVFSGGHDLAELIDRSEEDYHELFTLSTRVMLGLRRLPQPVIARVQGLATAAGCQLAASCDLIVAATAAAFATPGVKIGLFCTTPMVPLIRAIPSKTAFEMLLTGEPISAQRALELGLVNRVVPEADLDATIDTLSAALLSISPLVLRSGKRAFYDCQDLTERDAYDKAVPIMTEDAARPDAQEGIAAFIAKRNPVWPTS